MHLTEFDCTTTTSLNHLKVEAISLNALPKDTTRDGHFRILNP